VDPDAHTMTPEGLELAHDEPLLYFTRAQHVVIWPLKRVSAS